MLVVYSGVHSDIELDLPNGRLLVAARGEAFEVTDEMGASLLENADFAEPKGDKPKTTPAVAAEKE